ncbi:hypothetical protein [Aquihabitans sp. McL0605]|uniref:hypothetical protein n=1 Tax=Aquihabitans sp. McL0605 TaxID=3415671 RepID=UPI003CE71973
MSDDEANDPGEPEDPGTGDPTGGAEAPGRMGGSAAAAEAAQGPDPDDDEDLWGSSDPDRRPVDRRLIYAAIGVVAVIALAFVLFGGNDGSSDGTDAASGTKTSNGEGAVTQLTSQVAPYNAQNITPSTLPAGAVSTGCGDWDSAFNFPPKEVADGVYIWSDFQGWHVRLAGTAVSSLRGSVTGQYVPALQSPTTAQGVKVTKDDLGKALKFDLVAGEKPVGFDFSAGCRQKELTFDLTSNGTSVAPETIHLGSRGVVKEFPLVARRTLPVPG